MLYVRLYACILTAVLALVSAMPGIASTSSTSPVASSAVPVVRTAWLAEYEAFAAWYANDRKWDEENGILLEFKTFPTGKHLMDNMRNAGCVIGGGGGVAVVAGLLERKVSVIGIGADETEANALYVRSDSPLLSKKGVNPAFPNLYGSAELLPGKTLVAPLGTSAQQLLHAWLVRLGVNDADMIILDGKPEEALAAFMGGMGDVLALWAPYTMAAEQQGLRRVATGKDCGIIQPTLILSEQDFADQHPEQVTAFIKSYLRAIEAIAATPENELVPLYQRFMGAFGQPVSAETARMDIATHRFFNVDAQRALFHSGAVGDAQNFWLEDVIRFHQATGALSRRQIGALERTSLLNPRFLDEATR